MDTVRPFTDRSAIASYAEDTPRKVPGYADLHRMSMLLLAEAAAPTAEILVYGAGGGLELKAFADAQPEWRFVGVDPSVPMLDLARRELGQRMARVALIEGFIDNVPSGPFDGATCLLTMHFLDRDERARVLRELRRRMRPGARLVTAHHSTPNIGAARSWMVRSILFGDPNGGDLEAATRSADRMLSHLPLLTPRDEESLLQEAGFCDVGLFYAAFSFRGWTATA
ncbi:class I SAM-dependent methyltransferase [Sphingomonas gei]|uniref:Class I SAM-dependent methyltransferase n=1 Tax=Sphingomonas gei TaxID=1395960 RepID=A0A4S1X105_9SPHN|nr:class I SAM-dependent methyltransferase [Sphingomonas gei]TGX49581.1 class I SAM-dependent methyltransferase [Sphingomonas gei]